MTERTLIAGGTVVAAPTEPPIEDGAVLLEGTDIVDVGPYEDLASADHTQLIDASGRTVLPGLVDAHVHLTYTETTLRNRLEFTDPRNSREYNTIESIGIAETHLQKGITSIRDIGSRAGLAVAIRDAVEDGLIDGPRIVASGPILTTTGGLTDTFPEWLDAQTEFVREISGPRDAREAVREQAKRGVDNVKLEASGEWINPYSDSRTPTATREEIEAVVEEAHSRGLSVAAHAKAREAIENAVMAGVDTVEHGTFLDEATAALMRDHGVHLVTTTTCYMNVIEHGEAAYPPERVDVLRDEIDTHVDAIRLAHETGTPIAAGTDTGPPFSPHGHGAVADELAHLVEHSGFDPEEALLAGTETAARAIGLGDTVGTLEPGKRGDLIVVDGDPLSDVNVLREHDRIETVCKGGTVVKGG